MMPSKRSRDGLFFESNRGYAQDLDEISKISRHEISYSAHQASTNLGPIHSPTHAQPGPWVS